MLDKCIDGLSACMQCLNMCMFQAERMHMLHHVFLSLLLSLLLLAMVWFCQWYRFHHSSFQAKVARRALLPRALKPRSPLDCPACCDSSSCSSTQRPLSPVRPWREVKSRRGAPKQVKTEGFACPNRACVYYGMSSAQVHAPLWRWFAGPS